MNNQYSITKAQKSDKNEILSLYKSMIGSKGCVWDEFYPSVDIIAEDISLNSLYCLKDINNTIIATASCGKGDELNELEWNSKSLKPAELARVCVRKEYQNKGIASYLLSYIKSDIKKQGFDSIRLLAESNYTSANMLYKKNGFVCYGKTFIYDHYFNCYELML